MAALTAAKEIASRDPDEYGYPVLTATTIYKGAIVSVDDAGFAVPASDTAAHRVIGIAKETVLNPGASGVNWVKVVSGRAFLIAAVSITQAMVGDVMFVVDDQTVDDAAGTTNDVPVGRLVEFISTTSGWVFIDKGPRRKAGVASEAAGTFDAADAAIVNDTV